MHQLVMAMVISCGGDVVAEPKDELADSGVEQATDTGMADTASAPADTERLDRVEPRDDHCMGVQFSGCCTEDNILYSCSNGSLHAIECTVFGGTCGWSSEGELFTCSAQDTLPENMDPTCPDGLPQPEDLGG